METQSFERVLDALLLCSGLSLIWEAVP
jgi:hypothetical protein